MDRLAVIWIRCSPSWRTGLAAAALAVLAGVPAFGQSDEDFRGVIGTTVAESVADFPAQPRPPAGRRT